MITLAGEVLLEHLSPGAQEWMARLAQRKSYADGELIHSRGDAVTTMSVVIAGRIRLVRLRADGSQTFVSVIKSGQHFGDVLMLGKRRRRTHDAVADGMVVVDEYDADSFAQLLGHREILEALYRITALRLTGAMAMSDDLRSLPREVHLAKILLALSRQGEGREVIDSTQEDLAALLGTSAMTLAKCLANLRGEGLIETGYRQVRIADPEGLRAWLRGRTGG